MKKEELMITQFGLGLSIGVSNDMKSKISKTLEGLNGTEDKEETSILIFKKIDIGVPEIIKNHMLSIIKYNL